MAKGMQVKPKTQPKADHEKTIIEQETESKALVDTNANAHVFADNMIINDMLTTAAKFGELLDSDPTYAKDAEDIVKAKEIDDTKVVTFIKHIDRVLDADQRARLPWPGSIMAVEQAKLPAGSNQPLLFDKPLAAGQQTTFYSQMIGSTVLGKQAKQELEAIQSEIDKAKVDPDHARLPANLEADMRRAKTRFNNLISALRTAAQVRLMIEDMKHRCPYVVVEWIRQEIPDAQAELIDPNADLTMLNVEHAGDVVKSASCMSIWTKPLNPAFTQQEMKKAKTYSVGAFKRWKIDKAIEIAKAQQRTRVTVGDLIASAKAKAPTPKGPTPKAQTTRVVNSWTDLQTNADEILRYLTEDQTKASARHVEFISGVEATDEAVLTWGDMQVILSAQFIAKPALMERYRKLKAAMSDQKKTA